MVAKHIVFLSRLHNVDEVVGEGFAVHHVIFQVLSSADIHASVYLPAVGTDDFCADAVCQLHTIAVENEVADNMYQRSELDYLIYNDPVAYADLILNGDPETYLKTVTEYKPLDS